MTAPDRYISFNIFQPFNELICAFSTRTGGFSRGVFKSQNMGNTRYDDYQTVQKNRNAFYNGLNIPLEKVALPDQIHSANISVVSEGGVFTGTDALITQSRGLFLGLLTADCFPVFIFEPKIKVVSVIHAGWRGMVKDIIPDTLRLLQNRMNICLSNLHIAIGPGLQTECFEVHHDVFDHFSEKYLLSHQDHTKRYLNLSARIKDQFIEAGVREEHIEISRLCTKCNEDLFYSYRRDGLKSGRMMGIIGIR